MQKKRDKRFVDSNRCMMEHLNEVVKGITETLAARMSDLEGKMQPRWTAFQRKWEEKIIEPDSDEGTITMAEHRIRTSAQNEMEKIWNDLLLFLAVLRNLRLLTILRNAISDLAQDPWFVLPHCVNLLGTSIRLHSQHVFLSQELFLTGAHPQNLIGNQDRPATEEIQLRQLVER